MKSNQLTLEGMTADGLRSLHYLHPDNRALILILQSSYALLKGVIMTELDVCIRSMRSKCVVLPAANEADLHGTYIMRRLDCPWHMPDC